MSIRQIQIERKEEPNGEGGGRGKEGEEGGMKRKISMGRSGVGGMGQSKERISLT